MQTHLDFPRPDGDPFGIGESVFESTDEGPEGIPVLRRKRRGR